MNRNEASEVAARVDRHPVLTRTRVALVGTAAVALMLAGCTPASTGGDGEKVTLTYSIWDAPQEEATQAIIDAFEAENPDIEVELSVTPWAEYWTKLQTTATSGSAPDIFWMNTPNLPKYADGGVLLPLSDRIAADGFDLDAFAPAPVASATFDGEVYGIPKDVDALALWYNTAIFDAAGVPVPTDDWTWADMVEAATALTDPATGVYGIPALNTNQLSYYNTIPQSGGFVISDDGTESGYDDPATIAGIQAWVDLIDLGVSPTLQQMTDTDPTQMFQSGKLAMTFAGSWMIPVFTGDEAIKDSLGVVQMPLIDERGGVSNSVSNVGFAKSEHPDEVWKFLQFIGSETGENIIAESGVLPAMTSAQQVWADGRPESINTAAFLDTVAVNTAFPRSLDTAVWADYATETFNKAWTGEITVEEAAADVAAFMNDALAAERE